MADPRGGTKPVRWYLLKLVGEIAYRFGKDGIYYPCLNTMCATGFDWYGRPAQQYNYDVFPWMINASERREYGAEVRNG